MKKEQFLNELRERLVGLPKDDLDDRIIFYSEMIDDRIDEGKSEEGAIEEIGGVDKVVNDIAKETSLTKLVREKVRPKRRLLGWEIALIVLGFPLWLPLIIVMGVLIIVFYLIIWILTIVTYVVELALEVAAVASLVAFFMYLFEYGQMNYMMIGSAIMCLGAAILMVFGCIGATKLSIKISKGIVLGIKKSFMSKGSK